MRGRYAVNLEQQLVFAAMRREEPAATDNSAYGGGDRFFLRFPSIIVRSFLSKGFVRPFGSLDKSLYRYFYTISAKFTRLQRKIGVRGVMEN